MFIRKTADIRSYEITSKENYLHRRKFIKNSAKIGSSLLAMPAFGALIPTKRRAKLLDIRTSNFSTDENVTSFEDITTYNNYCLLYTSDAADE